MKFANLEALGHNLAHSLDSGVCFAIGLFVVDVYAEARQREPGFITVDFLRGTTTGTPSSAKLLEAASLFRDGMPEFAVKNRCDLREIRRLEATFGTDKRRGAVFSVLAENAAGRASVRTYVGGGSGIHRKMREEFVYVFD